jgi:hypothetical protein
MSSEKDADLPLIKGARLFRSQALSRLSATQDLDCPLRLSSMPGPLAMLSVILLLLSFIVWIA